MQGSSSSHKQEQGLFRKRGAPVLVELFKNANVAPQPVHAPSITPGQQGPAERRAAPQPIQSTHTPPPPSLFTPGVRPSDLNPPAHASASPSARPAHSTGTVVEPKVVIPPAAPPTPVRPAPSGFKRDIASNAAPARREGFGAWYLGLSQTGRSVLFGITGLVILAPIVWMIAFNRGQTQATEQIVSNLPVQPPPMRPPNAAPVQTPVATGPGITNVTPPPVPVPSNDGAAAARTPDVDAGVVIGELRKGLNYLIAGTFKRQKDADDTAAFLNSQGLVSRVITTGEMQGGSSKDLMVVVLYGFPRETWSLTEQVRKDLTTNVQRLGQQWKMQNRLAPTDLSQPYMIKFAG